LARIVNWWVMTGGDDTPDQAIGGNRGRVSPNEGHSAA
jgi:hypothetical protein